MAFLAGLAGGMAVLGMVFFADDRLHATPAQVGMLGATWSMFYVFGCFVLRPLAARLHPRHSLLAATVLLCAMVYAICLASSLFWVFLFYSIFGLSVALFWPPIMGWMAAGVEGVHLSRSIGWFNLCWSSGSILGQGLAGWLGDIDTLLPMAVSGTVYLAAACLILGAILALPHLAAESPAPRTGGMPDQAAAAQPEIMRVSSWVGAFCAFVSLGVLLNVFPIAARIDLGFVRGQIGLLLLIRGLSYAVILGALGRFKFWHFRRGPMLLNLVLLALICWGLILARNALALMAIMACQGIITAFAYTSSLFHGVAGEQDAVRRAGRMAIHESVVNGGSILGASMGGLVYGYMHAPAAYAFCAGMALLGLLAQALIFRRSGKF